jgi:hypothetical protein
VIPSGATADCGSSPRRRATALVDREWMSRPSSSTRPAEGFNIRAKDFNRVDLPQALGPMMTVNSPSGISTSSRSLTATRPYPSVARSALSGLGAPTGPTLGTVTT